MNWDFLKNKWTYVIVLAALAFISGGAYADKLAELILKILGG